MFRHPDYYDAYKDFLEHQGLFQEIFGQNTMCDPHFESSNESTQEIQRGSSRDSSNESRELDGLFSERLKDFKDKQEIADRNAYELIKQEEEEELKAYKKKAKKKRQKEKKALKKPNKSNNFYINDNTKEAQTNNVDSASGHIGSEAAEEDTLDLNSAFLSKALGKVSDSNRNVQEELRRINTKEDPEEEKLNKTVCLMYLAMDYARTGNFLEAIKYLSEAVAIKSNHSEVYLKRSIYYYEIAEFAKSLKDAERAIKYDPKNAEAYVQQGEVYFAFNKYDEAQTAFTNALELNPNCEVAQKRLLAIRSKYLVDMGYHPNDVFTAFYRSKTKTVEDALEYLNRSKDDKDDDIDIYYSDESEEDNDSDDDDDDTDQDDEESCDDYDGKSSTAPSPSKRTISNHSSSWPVSIDPSNPVGCKSLYIGNVSPKITHACLFSLFSAFGKITNIRVIRESNCAFVNYDNNISPGDAMKVLQGHRVSSDTPPLVIKYPTNAMKQLTTNKPNATFHSHEDMNI